MDDTKALIENQFKTLPSELQAALKTVPWENSVVKIGKTSGFADEVIEDLKRETMLVLYGFEPASDFPENLERELSLSPEAADELATLIYDEVFTQVEAEAEKASAEEKTPSLATTRDVIESRLEIEAPEEEKKPIEEKREALQAQTTEASAPIPETKVVSYPGGKDPYREPLE